MDGNKDESEHCISLAQKYINEGDRTKALKFLYKAEKLYPSQRAKGKFVIVQTSNLILLKCFYTNFTNVSSNHDMKINIYHISLLCRNWKLRHSFSDFKLNEKIAFVV